MGEPAGVQAAPDLAARPAGRVHNGHEVCVVGGGGMNSYRAFPIVKDLHPIESTPHVRTHSLSLFGGTQRASMPVFISPAGVHCLMDKEGEAATARAARRAGGFRRMY